MFEGLGGGELFSKFLMKITSKDQGASLRGRHQCCS